MFTPSPLFIFSSIPAVTLVTDFTLGFHYLGYAKPVFLIRENGKGFVLAVFFSTG